MFGLMGGAPGVGGGIAAAVEYVCSPRSSQCPARCYIRVVLAVTVAGATCPCGSQLGGGHGGEVPTTLSDHRRPLPVRRSPTYRSTRIRARGDNRWAATSYHRTVDHRAIKAMVGFLFLYPAFVAKSHDASGWEQLRILGLIGAAAAVGNFAGNLTAARLKLGRPAVLVVRCTVAVTAMALAAAVTGNLFVVAAATLVTSAASADRQGVAGCVPAERPARGVTSVGVRAFGVRTATGVGARRCPRSPRVHRPVGGVHRHLRAADTRPGPDRRQLPRRLVDPRPRRQSAGHRAIRRSATAMSRRRW